MVCFQLIVCCYVVMLAWIFWLCFTTLGIYYYRIVMLRCYDLNDREFSSGVLSSVCLDLVQLGEFDSDHKFHISDVWRRSTTFGRGKKGADNKGATKRAQNKKGTEQKGHRTKRAQNKKGEEQKGREITMLRHRYIQGRNFFR